MVSPRFRLVPYRLLPWVDWFLILNALALAAFGIITIWGAISDGSGPGRIHGYALQQLKFLIFGLGAMIFFIVFDYRLLRRIVWMLYPILLLLLVGLLAKGETIKGARSWYELGWVHFQPSEPGKIIIILMLANYLARKGKRFRGLRDTIKPMLILGVPLGLILVQPDLGTAVVLVPIAGAMFWVAGLRKRVIFSFLLLGVAVVFTAYPLLKPYQKERIKTFMNPEADPRGKGYNIIQARTTLGSGELLGKGWGRGTQTNMKFLPEYHTDFVFPTVGEQFGIVGTLLAISLFFVLIARMVHLADVTQNLFGTLIITGLTAAICTHIIMNIGMTVGLLPVTGLPLPFFSYGGSFLLTCMISIGLTVGIGARRGL